MDFLDRIQPPGWDAMREDIKFACEIGAKRPTCAIDILANYEHELYEFLTGKYAEEKHYISTSFYAKENNKRLAPNYLRWRYIDVGFPPTEQTPFQLLEANVVLSMAGFHAPFARGDKMGIPSTINRHVIAHLRSEVRADYPDFLKVLLLLVGMAWLSRIKEIEPSMLTRPESSGHKIRILYRRV
ncbi:MAG: hypothetical protein Q3962_07850 [Corynebacterium sp.]|nr:hypothetical protein [Corynebacterium sp.]